MRLAGIARLLLAADDALLPSCPPSLPPGCGSRSTATARSICTTPIPAKPATSPSSATATYDQAVLRQLNIFLADWRTKEPTKMDPALFDLIWAVYQEVGASQPVNIVSSYRSPKTNAMLRAKSSGVAENSQHIQGKAMDIFIPGIELSTLRDTAMRHQVGGVGYYPTSGSPFVHVDTGSSAPGRA